MKGWRGWKRLLLTVRVSLKNFVAGVAAIRRSPIWARYQF